MQKTFHKLPYQLGDTQKAAVIQPDRHNKLVQTYRINQRTDHDEQRHLRRQKQSTIAHKAILRQSALTALIIYKSRSEVNAFRKI